LSFWPNVSGATDWDDAEDGGQVDMIRLDEVSPENAPRSRKASFKFRVSSFRKSSRRALGFPYTIYSDEKCDLSPRPNTQDPRPDT